MSVKTDGVTEAVLTQISQDIHTTALEKGFWNPMNPFIAEMNAKLLLIVSEVIEAQQVLREDWDGDTSPYTFMTQAQGEAFIEELADIIIRTFDLAQWFGSALPPVATVITAKMATNANRPYKHNKKF